MKQQLEQLEQLLKDTEEVTAKMREVLAQMGKPAPWMPKKGDWAEVVSADGGDSRRGLNIGDIVQIDEDNNSCPYVLKDGKTGPDNTRRYCIYTHQLRHLPDYKPKPALAATYSEVVDVVKPKWTCKVNGEFINWPSSDPYQLPTESAAKQDRAYIQIKNLEAYCAAKFEGERDYIIDICSDGKLFPMECTYGIIKVTEKAAEWLIANHPEPFLVFFGVKS